MGSNEWHPSPDDETYLNALDGIDAVEGIDATRFNLPAIGWGAFTPSALEALIPPRRGPVQGPAAPASRVRGRTRGPRRRVAAAP
ncbi:hypothetical protein [Actinocrinis sp.]|uniref:hypothetical protein n=1 Tax=Actinocrinis sp. TaxID=1920516 RepID=UPI002D32CACF|nr:hypothetical protein [Actinocrinis sp.]HZP50068.1 hypothetical protein [Actinocrinis sp.]